MDLRNATLTVSEVILEDYGEKRHVMDVSDDLHINCRILLDDNGVEYPFEEWSTQYKDDNKVQYGIVFIDQSIELEPGTVLKLGPQLWRQDIPDSKVIKLDYHSQTAVPTFGKGDEFYLEVVGGIEVTASANGEVTLKTPQTDNQKNARIAYTRTDPQVIQKLFQDMLRCVSGDDCYQEQWYDDTGRSFTFYFEDGTKLEYSTVFNYGEVNTVNVINQFLKYCEGLNAFRMKKKPHEKDKEKIFFEDEDEKKEEKENDNLDGIMDIAEDIGEGIEKIFKPIAGVVQDAADSVVDKGKELNEMRRKWYEIGSDEDDCDGWSKENDLIFDKACDLGIRASYLQGQGCRIIGVFCNAEEMEELLKELGETYSAGDADFIFAGQFEKNARREKDIKEANKTAKDIKKKKDDLGLALKEAVDTYNAAYREFNDFGTKLFYQRERSVDLLDNVENLVNSIANHPKEFDADIGEIQVSKKKFKDECDYAKEELDTAKKSAMGAGAGVAGGMAVASLAPSAAMWVATTFGTASTGTAISALSGAAAESAALAWLGGGTVAMGGGGTAAGTAFLALSGPVGWSIAGATILASIGLFANKKMKLSKEKKEEIESVLKNTEQLKEFGVKIREILEKTSDIRKGLNKQYTLCMPYFGDDFLEIPEDGQLALGTLVNNAKALAVTLEEEIGEDSDGTN